MVTLRLREMETGHPLRAVKWWSPLAGKAPYDSRIALGTCKRWRRSAIERVRYWSGAKPQPLGVKLPQARRLR